MRGKYKKKSQYNLSLRNLNPRLLTPRRLWNQNCFYVSPTKRPMKIFCNGGPKSAVRGGKIFFFHRGIRKKILGMVTNFQVWVAWRFFE